MKICDRNCNSCLAVYSGERWAKWKCEIHFCIFTRPLRACDRRHFDLGGTNLIEHKNSILLRRRRNKQSTMNDDEFRTDAPLS